MTEYRAFSELTKRWSAKRNARVAIRAAKRKTMTLEELRLAYGLSQEEMAAALKINQPAVSKLEKRDNITVLNLRRYIEALGGKLELRARFADESVIINR